MNQNGAVAGDGALVQVRSCETLVILITSFGEFLLYFIVPFYFIFTYKKKSAAGSFLCCLVSALFVLGIHFQWIENFKASSLGSVGKLTERKWNTHMESNTVMRVTLELT